MAEKDSISPGMVQYLEIKKSYPDYLLFYRMGDFYELFFDDAKKASAALDITLTKRGQIKGENVPMCGVPFHAYEAYMARLIKAGYKVAICEQMENPEDAKKRGSKSVVKRDVIRLVTPGTLTEDSLLDARKNNYLLCLSRAVNAYGAAWIDLSTGEFYTQGLEVNSQNEAAELYGLLTRLEPSEILISDALLNNPELFHLFNEFKEKLSVLPQARFNYAGAVKKVCAFYNVAAVDALGDFSKPELTAAGLVLEYVENTQKGKMPRIAVIKKIIDSQYMEIDAATRHNLDLFDGPRGSSLISVMDRTVTGAGARMLASRLSAPQLDLAEINRRLDAVSFFCKHHDVRQKLRELLKMCPDLERAISRLSIGRGGPRDLKAIADTLKTLPQIKLAVSIYQHTQMVDEVEPAVDNILKRIGNHTVLLDKLESAVREPTSNHELPLLARDGDFIKRGYNTAFDALCDLRDKGEEMISELQGKYAQKTGIDSLKVKYNNVVGYFIEVQNKYTTQLLADPEFIHRQSVLNATRFTTTELTELENNLRSAKERALAMEISIFEDLVRDVMLSADGLIRTANAAAELDVASALADLALECNYCRPQLDDSLVFEVEEGRHPVVEAALRRDNDGTFVGNDCHLHQQQNRIWLITGPNMAGKSTFLRQNAIIAIMAQSGSFVPAKSAHIGLVNKVFSRVGASDDLSRGRSTFMVEMVETAAILNRADERSLVILDEIGRGTATFDGLSIAWAVVEYLHEVNKCRALFATHYHELAVLAEKLSALTLHCMKIKEFKEQVVFLHEVIDGAADRSYGIHVAKLAGLPAAVIQRAGEVLKKLEKDNQKNDTADLSKELPLFAFAQPVVTETIIREKESAVEEALKEIEPDNLTAREALQKLYELKELAEEK